jgi:hypothetical protein
MSAESKVNYIDHNGTQHDVEIRLEDYRAAEEAGMSLAAYYNVRHPTNVEQNGTAFAQFARSCGLFAQEDRHFGIRAPTLKDIFNGKAALMGNAVVRPDGTNSNTPAGRLLFPAVLTEQLESSLREDKETYVGTFMQAVAFTTTVDSPRYDQVVINYDRPRAARGQVITQLADPARMLSITTSDIQKRIPTYALGMEISDQAMAAATLDLIGLAVREHAIEERAYQVMRDFGRLVNGSVDTGDTALPSVTAASFDSTISTAGTLTQKAWVKYLRTGWMKRSIDWVFCDIDTYLAIENRTGVVTVQSAHGVDERLYSVPRVVLPGLQPGVKVFILEDATILGANTLVGVDSRKGMRRVVYVGANYEAVEQFVIQRKTVMRLDWAERIERLGYDEAFSKMTLTV